jgi:hypothetical protein
MVYLMSKDKDGPAHGLEAIKTVFSDTKSLNITGSALQDAFAVGYGTEEIIEVIQSYKTWSLLQINGF